MSNTLRLHGVALGTFPFSNVFGKVTKYEAEEIVATFIARGMGYIQTAPYYKGVDHNLRASPQITACSLA
jgi:predicted aldo/keto reductase-like oxidoreductase